MDYRSDLPTTPTADLLAEWGKLTAITKDSNYARDTTFDKIVFEGKIAAIAAELDKRCSEVVGVWINSGQVWFDPEKLFGYEDPESGMITAAQPFASATELRDLLTWLLLKGGNG